MKAKKTAILHMRLTPDDKIKLEVMAKQQQKSISSLITKIINNEYNNQGATIETNHGSSEQNERPKAKNRIRKSKRAKQIVKR